MPTDVHTTIGTTVTCAFSIVEEPFHHRYPSETTVSRVLEAAMSHFGASPEPGYVFYLTHDRVRQDDTTTLGALAGHKDEVRFRLVKEIVQG